MDSPLLTLETYFLTEGVANILASKDLVAVAEWQDQSIKKKFYYKSQVVSEFFRLISLYSDLHLR